MSFGQIRGFIRTPKLPWSSADILDFLVKASSCVCIQQPMSQDTSINGHSMSDGSYTSISMCKNWFSESLSRWQKKFPRKKNKLSSRKLRLVTRPHLSTGKSFRINLIKAEIHQLCFLNLVAADYLYYTNTAFKYMLTLDYW